MKTNLKRVTALITSALLLSGMLSSCEGTATPPEDTGTDASSAVTEHRDDTPGEPVVLYVSPDGDDNNPGTLDSPLATPAAAQKLARAAKKENIDTDVTVYFREGVYEMKKSLGFNQSDSGTKESPVIYAAYNGESVTFSGAQKIDPSLITPAEDEIKARVIDEGAREALLKIDMSSLKKYITKQYCAHDRSYTWGVDPYNVSAGNQTDIEQRIGYLPYTLYMGDTPLTYTRWPNDSFQMIRTPVVEKGKDADKTVSFGFNPQVKERVSLWSHDVTDNLYMYGDLQFDWTGEVFRIDDVDWEEETLTIHGGGWYYSAYKTVNTGKYYFFNLPEEIDLPGEYYMDYENSAAYFYPGEDFDIENVSINALATPVIALYNTENIVFDGINITHGKNNAVYAENVNGLTIRNAELAHVGNQVVRADGKNIVISGCRCYDASHGGLYLTGGDRVTLEPSGNVIENCEIHDVVTGEYPQFAIKADSVGMRIANNEIYNHNSTGISLGSNDIVIEYNDIHDICLTASDTGAINYWGTGGLLGTVIRYNCFHDLGNSGSVGTNYIYVDGMAPGCEVYGNLFIGGATTDASVKANQYTNVHNNIFLKTDAAVVNVPVWLDSPSLDYKSYNMTNAQIRYSAMYEKIQSSSARRGKDLLEVKADGETYREHYKGTIWEAYLDLWSEETFAKYEKMSDEEFVRYIQENGIDNPLAVWCDGNVLCDVQYVVDDTNALTAEERGLLTPEDYRKAEDESVLNGELAPQCILGTNMKAERSWFRDYDGGDYSFTAEGLENIRKILPGFEELPLDKIGIGKN